MSTSRKPNSSKDQDLPPQRQGKAMHPVKPPLSSTPLHRHIYTLVGIATLLTAYYSYRTIQWKTEVGGWWNLATGVRPERLHHHHSEKSSKGRGSKGKGGDAGGTVESKINELALALGLPSNDLAKAIASAVREYVPPASLSSIREKETGSPAVDVLLAGAEQGKKVEEDSGEENTEASPGMLDSFVGLDEP
ncbi:hypothetical protein D9758_014133 [Tetrapyrgos nigripes]|uniref:Uncharacterized protein n=1 Tax=Tetrapyrgos nigripes TaxID=182062 RepID=A0A8H5FP72_9AGAR|nr:hypothetical protein D9758_014133 [Tetrapyrgos nigripes]